MNVSSIRSRISSKAIFKWCLLLPTGHCSRHVKQMLIQDTHEAPVCMTQRTFTALSTWFYKFCAESRKILEFSTMVGSRIWLMLFHKSGTVRFRLRLNMYRRTGIGFAHAVLGGGLWGWDHRGLQPCPGVDDWTLFPHPQWGWWLWGQGSRESPKVWSEQEGWEGKRSRGLGDGGGGWKSSKRVEVARALKRNLFAVLCTALCCTSVKLSLLLLLDIMSDR